jgi:hypothetical protein
MLCVCASSTTVAAEADQKNVSQREKFFESRVRPLLVKHCFECHGPKKQQTDLRLDSREAILKGNDSGPAIIPGQPATSRLIEVVRYRDDDIQMPPKGKLAAEQIAVLTEWIRQGAFFPSNTTRPSNPHAGEIDFAKARQSHWAFRPVTRPELPLVKDTAWPRTLVDYFVLAKLEAAGLFPSPHADRRTLIRRVTFDLIGLPPTFEDVQDFVNDPSPDSYEKVVDRLLASPHHGERWGRHWLDVARYADSKGYVFAEETRYPYAYTYRDYVIRAFNDDLPYDRFVLEQIAADRLKANSPSALAALGFLTVGRRFRNSAPDIIDDRIDVVMRGLMGLTVACARCHDHKYDPLPTEDYYSLYGVFASSYEPDDLPLLGKPEKTSAYLAYEKELNKRQAVLDKHVGDNYRKLLDELRSGIGEYLLRVVKSTGEVNRDFALSFNPGDPRPIIVAAWRVFLKQKPKEHQAVFSLWHAFADLPHKQFAPQAQELLEQFRKAASPEASRPGVNPLLLQAFLDTPPESMIDVAKVYGTLLSGVYNKQKENKNASEEIKQLRQVLFGKGTPTAISLEQGTRLFDRETRNKGRELKKKVQQWKLSSQGAPPRAMVLLDRPEPVTPVVFVRGNASRKGKPVPRRFPQVLAGENGRVFQKGSGRLEMAELIVDPSNPLTARVLVNRIWMYHFSKPLVDTPSDFGARSQLPTHPQLLDALAAQFVQQDWSIKTLHRLILLSSVYRQSSDDHLKHRAIDPQNRLLWNMPRRRIDFEAMRDAMLCVSGSMDCTMQGRPVDLLKQPFSDRRTVYGFVNRNNLPSLFRIFDFANPDASTGRRANTTVPQQALFAMNSPFVIEQADRLASHPDVTSRQNDAEKIRALYRRVLSRDPHPEEISLAVRFIHHTNTPDSGVNRSQNKNVSKMNPWARFAQILLLTNEFLFLD